MKFLYCIFLSCCLFQSDSFVDKVVNDFRMNSKFLALNIKALDYIGSVIIENDDLYLFYQLTYHKNKADYKSFIKNCIEKKITIDIGNHNLDKWNFIKVKKNISVSNNLKKGLDKFIKVYFNKNMVEKENVKNEERANIIKILFDNKIACYIDDETGLLLINKM